MNDLERKKNMAIKEQGKETRLRHASMRPFVIELKLELKCLDKTEQNSALGTLKRKLERSRASW